MRPQICPINMVYGIYNYSIVTGSYKPTYNWGGPHCKSSETINDKWAMFHSVNNLIVNMEVFFIGFSEDSDD